MAIKKKVRTPKYEGKQRGRHPKYGRRMVRQISIGLDTRRAQQLSLIHAHLANDSCGEVTESDVMRIALDQYVISLGEEVPGLKEIV